RGADRGVPRLCGRPWLPGDRSTGIAVARADDLARPYARGHAGQPLPAFLGALARGSMHVIVILAVLVAWEAVASSGVVTQSWLPMLGPVLERFWAVALSGELFLNIGLTLYRAFTGFFIAAAGGIVLGMAMSRSVGVNWLFAPIISVGSPMPKIAFLPV